MEGEGSDGEEGRAGKGVGLARDLGSRGLPKGVWKKAAELAMRAAVFRGAAGELRPVVEVPCGKIRGECAGSPLTWRRTCPERARGACGAADGRTPCGRRRRIARTSGQARLLELAEEMKPDEEVLHQRSCRQAEGRVGKAESAKLRSAGAEGQVKPVQRFGAVRSDMRRLIFLRRLGCVANGFPGRVCGRRSSAASFCGAQRAISGSGVQQKRSFFPSRKKFPCK